MADLNFPKDRTELVPPGTGSLQTGDSYTANGTTWVYDATAGVWGSGTGDAADAIYLSRVNDDTAAGAITFEGRTTHEAGVSVTGGDVAAISTGLYAAGTDNDLRVAINNSNTLRFTDQENILNALARGSNATSGNLRILFANFLATDFTGRTDVNAVYTKFESAVDVTGTCDSFHGFRVDRGTNGVGFATDAYGFYSELNADSSTGAIYNFYAPGNAPNYFAGNLKIASSPDDVVSSPQSSGVLLTNTNIDITRRSGTADVGCLGLRRSAAANGSFISFSSADGSASDFGGTDARIRLSGYGNVVTTGITNTFSISRTAAAPAAIADAVTAIKALSPGVTGFAAQDLIDNAHVAVIEDDAEKDEILVDQTKLIPLLTKALQEALDKIETLETRLSDAGIA